jgi:hypothetical protein
MIRKKKISNKTLNVCSVLVVSLKTIVEKSRYDVWKFFRWAHTFCVGMEGEFVVSLVRDKHCFVLRLYPFFIFFLFYNYSFTLSVIYSPPKIRRTHLPMLGTRMGLIWGCEALRETNFKRVFLFLMYDVYVATVSSLIKLNYSCVLESFTILS